MGAENDKTEMFQTQSLADVAFLAKKVNNAQNKFRAYHVPRSRILNVSIVNLFKFYLP